VTRNLFRTGRTESDRVEAFSDGVLAIVITLLVLEIKVPQVVATDAALWGAMLQLLPKVLAWVVSFAFVLVFWVAHHYFFNGLKHVDRGLLWLNGLFLLCISFTPFPTGFVGDYPLARPPLVLLNCVMLVTACAFSAMRWYATAYPGLYEEQHLPRARAALKRSMVGPALYLIGFMSAFVSPFPAIAVQVIVPILFFLPGATFVGHQDPTDEALL
jgi:uncharacterized membrane protein